MHVQPVDLTSADDEPSADVKVNVWVGPTGSTTGQFGRFASIVAQAVDNRGTGFVRRLEVTQESFAKFAYWSNAESMLGTTIYFNSGDQLWGPVWSNDVIHIGSGGATFHDDVEHGADDQRHRRTAPSSRATHEHQTAITLPSTAMLRQLAGYAAAAGYNFTAADHRRRDARRCMRIEFVATDLNGDGDSTGRPTRASSASTRPTAARRPGCAATGTADRRRPAISTAATGTR